MDLGLGARGRSVNILGQSRENVKLSHSSPHNEASVKVPEEDLCPRSLR